jgi:hypothetical protein
VSAVWVECPKCGAKRDTSNRFTSPDNARRDAEQWEALHRDGKCVEANALLRDDLVAQYEDAQRRRRVAIDDEMQLRAQIRALDNVARPVFPTAEQRAGIATACQRLRDEVPSKSHHGDPCGPEGSEYIVTCEQQCGRVNVYAKAPYKFDSAERQWSLNERDVDAFRLLFEAEGFEVFSTWRHDDGAGFLLRAA